jgi:hypothetical protein
VGAVRDWISLDVATAIGVQSLGEDRDNPCEGRSLGGRENHRNIVFLAAGGIERRILAESAVHFDRGTKMCRCGTSMGIAPHHGSGEPADRRGRGQCNRGCQAACGAKPNMNITDWLNKIAIGACQACRGDAAVIAARAAYG